MAAPRTIVIPALKKHTSTMICLHGAGDTGAGWTFLAENFRGRGKFDNMAFVFPSAPSIPFTCNGGMHMPGWWDIHSFERLNKIDDEAGINRTRSYILSLIDEQMAKGIPAQKIIVGGFSQGGAMALFAGLTCQHRLAGTFALSSFLPLEDKFHKLRAESGNQKPAVFFGIGLQDPIVKSAWGRSSAKGLEEEGVKVSYNEYPGLPHSTSPQELDDLEKWVHESLADDTESARV